MNQHDPLHQSSSIGVPDPSFRRLISEIVLERTVPDRLRAIAIGTSAERWERDCEQMGVEVVRPDNVTLRLSAGKNQTSYEVWRGGDRWFTTDQFGNRTPAFVKAPFADRGPQVDMVLVDGSDFVGIGLLEHSARLKTASWLSLLKAGGRLIVVLDQKVNGHSVDCWSRHLACFPGRLTRLVSNSTWKNRLLRWFPVGRRIPRHTALTTWAVLLQCPAESVSATEWNSHAQRGVLTGQKDCCSAALTTLELRRAA